MGPRHSHQPTLKREVLLPLQALPCDLQSKAQARVVTLLIWFGGFLMAAYILEALS